MLFQKKEKKLLAVADGKAMALNEVADEAFASGIDAELLIILITSSILSVAIL